MGAAKTFGGAAAGGLLGSALLGPLGGLLGAALGKSLGQGKGLLGAFQKNTPQMTSMPSNAFPSAPSAPRGGGAGSGYSQSDFDRAAGLSPGVADAMGRGEVGLW